MTISLYLRATMQQAILRLQPTMSRISIAELKAMSWSLKDLEKERIWLVANDHLKEAKLSSQHCCIKIVVNNRITHNDT